MEFGILGPLAVWTDGRELPLGAPKQRALLAVLLLRRNELVPTATLVDLLWGERPPTTAVKAVQVYVSQLRKTLGERAVETRALGYVLRVDHGAVDLDRFEELLARGRALLAEGAAAEAGDVLRGALGLWRGPALADFRYDAFARDATSRLEELRLVALEQRLEVDLALGRHAEAVPELEALVREHPLRESLCGLLMIALYRAGRQADALAAYQDARATLVDELGLDPGESLQRLEGAILRHDVSLDLAAAAPPAPADRPAAPSVRRRPAPAEVICSNCGTANRAGAQFCQSCGAPLAPDAPVERRKTVTVLCCDVTARTDGAARLDPEALRHAMSRFFELATDAIERHGGTVERFVGDEAMAVFGVPAVREDDALRAVRAALELRDAVAALEPEGARLEVRIAIDSGEVIAGDSAAGPGFVTGEAVVLARRLVRSAGAGEVVLGEQTHALVAHAVEATPLAPLGVENPPGEMTPFRLESLEAGAAAVPRREDSPLIDRERELAWLRRIYAEVAGGAGSRHVAVVGDAGIGKSRFAREFLGGVADEARVLVGRCPPYGEGITFLPLRELLGQADRDADELAGSSHEIFATARRILEELARERPLVAVFDDVHWAEPTFLDFVEYLASRLGDAPVLLLCLARPELADRRPAWLRPPTEALVLEPLSEVDSRKLLEALGVAAPVRPRIAEAAEGNPLFVEQLAAIADEYGTGGEMPGSIRGVLHERLDRLEPRERALLERAAVAGRSFSYELVLELTREVEREDVDSRLLGLVRKGFVRPDPTTADEGFRFHHALIRDATYDGISKNGRADLHEHVAARLESEAAEEALIGYHLEQAFRFRRELGGADAELGARAGRLLLTAGRRAFGLGDLPATVSLLRRARALLPPDEGAQLLPRLGEALFEAGRFAEADAVLAEAIDAAPSDPLLQARARVERQFVRLQVETGAALDEARGVALAALDVFEQGSDDLGRCRAWCLVAWIEWTEGHAGAADEAWQRAALHARAAGEERQLYEILGWRASAAVLGPTPVEEAIRTCTEIRAQVESSPVAVFFTLHPLAALLAMSGDFDEARALVREGNAILGDVDRMQSAVSHHETLVEMLAGNPAEAAQRLRLGYERLEQMGEKAMLATTAAMLAEALYAQERFREAARFCSVGEATAAAEDLLTQVIWREVRAKLLARQGKLEKAEALAREAVRLVAQTDLLTRQGDALLDLAEVLRGAGRTADADAAAREALDRYTRKGNAVGAEHARSLIATSNAR